MWWLSVKLEDLILARGTVEAKPPGDPAVCRFLAFPRAFCLGRVAGSLLTEIDRNFRVLWVKACFKPVAVK